MKICIPIREKTLAKAQKQIKKALKYADFLEIWLDVWPKQNLEFNLESLIKIASRPSRSEAKPILPRRNVGATLPVIAVCRAANEKGSFRGTEKERVERLFFGLRAGAKFIDVGIYTEPKLIKKLKATCRKHHAKLIISTHIYKNTPPTEKLEKLALKAKKLGADIIKIATTVRALEDNTILFELTKRLKERGLECIVVGMGDKGKISRIGCPLLGSFLTYIALDKKSKTAPGQLAIDELRNLKLS